MQPTQRHPLTLTHLVLPALLFTACAQPHPPSSPPSSRVVDITAGASHTCMLLAGGQIQCWGLNDNGQLGDGTLTNRALPEDVIGMMVTAKAIAAGERHTCAVTTKAAVKCWGSNHDNQLGDGTNVDRVAPTDVAGLTSGMRAVAAGEQHTCGLTAAGGVKCWGSNRKGQLGDGTGVDRTIPVDVAGLTSGVSAIAAGWQHTCAVTIAGEVKCWGENQDGQLGDGTAIDKTFPVDVTGLNSVVRAIAAGARHTCVLTVAGGVKCWGNNQSGQLGDGSVTARVTPLDVAGLTGNVSAIVTGKQHSCALDTSGTVKCWGDNRHREVGDDGESEIIRPIEVRGHTRNARALAAGGEHTCALSQDKIHCWGSNVYGQLGRKA